MSHERKLHVEKIPDVNALLTLLNQIYSNHYLIHQAGIVGLLANKKGNAHSELESKMELLDSVFRESIGIFGEHVQDLDWPIRELHLNSILEYMGNFLRKAGEIQKEYLQLMTSCAPEDLEQLKQESDDFIKIIQSIHRECYHPIAVIVNKTLQEDQERIEKINVALGDVQSAFLAIEEKLKELGRDHSGVEQLRKSFSHLLLCGTIHKSDFNAVIQLIEKAITLVNDTVPEAHPYCHQMHNPLEILKDNLKVWRKSTVSYVSGLAVQTGGILAAGSLAVALPVVPFVHHLRPLVSTLTEHTASMTVEAATERLADQVCASSERSPDQVCASSESSESKFHKASKSKSRHFLGKEHIEIELETGNIMLETEHLWRELLILESLKEWALQNKVNLGISGVTMTLGIIFVLSGMESPLGMLLLAGGATAASLAHAAYNEREHRKIEEEVRKMMKTEMELIGHQLELLELGEYRRNFRDYRQDTLAFVTELLNKLKLESKNNTATNKIVRELALLKTKLEAPGGLLESIAAIERLDDNSSVEDTNICVTQARAKVAEIESALASLYDSGSIARSPLMTKLDETTKTLTPLYDKLPKEVTFVDNPHYDKSPAKGLFSDKSESKKVLATGRDIVRAQYDLQNIHAMFPVDYFKHTTAKVPGKG